MRNSKIKLKKELKLLSGFLHKIDKRSSEFLSREALPWVLEKYFTTFEKERELLPGAHIATSEWAEYDRLLRHFREIFKKIILLSIKSESSAPFSLFKNLKEHIKRYKEEKDYLEREFAISFSDVFLNTACELRVAWEHFPREFRITKNNLNGEYNFFVLKFLKEFLAWAQRRIFKKEEGIDMCLERYNNELFPGVDPITWSKILIFYLTGFSAEAMIKNYSRFGVVGRVLSYSGSADDSAKWGEQFSKDLKSLEENAYGLALEIPTISQHFTEEKIEKYISDFKSLKYEKDSDEDKKRKRFIQIMKGLQEHRREQPLEKLKE